MVTFPASSKARMRPARDFAPAAASSRRPPSDRREPRGTRPRRLAAVWPRAGRTPRPACSPAGRRRAESPSCARWTPAPQGYDGTRGGCSLKNDSAAVRRIGALDGKSIRLPGSVEENFQVARLKNREIECKFRHLSVGDMLNARGGCRWHHGIWPFLEKLRPPAVCRGVIARPIIRFINLLATGKQGLFRGATPRAGNPERRSTGTATAWGRA